MLRDIQSMEFAHDLKVPLQLISSCVQLLEAELEANTRAEEYLRTLARSANQLQNMVQNALENDEIRRGKRDVVKDARELAREFDVLARRRGVKVVFSANASKFSMQTDGEKLRRILDNLLANALRFTPPGGRIGLDVRLLGDSVEFSVEDTGCGIPEKVQAKVFEPGYTTGGTGHGLAIAKKYAGMLGGSINLQSRPGLGSRFTLRIPV